MHPFFRSNCTRGDDCQYGHILGTDGQPLKIAPDLLARFDKFAAAKREAKKKGAFSTQMLVLNALEQVDSKSIVYWTLVQMPWYSQEGTKCEVQKHNVRYPAAVRSLGWWCKWWPCDGEEYHAGAIEGAVTTVVAHLTCWMAVYPESGQVQSVCFDPMLLLPRRYRN